MEPNHKIRNNSGIVCSILKLSNGKSRVILDDVSNSQKNEQGPWTHQVLYTHKDFDTKTLQELNLTEEEYASFGHAVFARLVALQKSPYK